MELLFSLCGLNIKKNVSFNCWVRLFTLSMVARGDDGYLRGGSTAGRPHFAKEAARLITTTTTLSVLQTYILHERSVIIHTYIHIRLSSLQQHWIMPVTSTLIESKIRLHSPNRSQEKSGRDDIMHYAQNLDMYMYNSAPRAHSSQDENHIHT